MAVASMSPWGRPDDRDESLSIRVLCHELRTPVQALAALTRALAEQPALTTPDRRAIAALAYEHAVHLGSLLDDLGVPGARDEPEPPRHAPLAAVVRAVTAGAGSRLRTRLDRAAAGLPVPEQHVRRILANLVGNALRHGPAGGEIVVRATIREATLTMSVRDQGGPCPALRTALARPAPSATGHGLGLWIVRRLVDTYGGTLRARRPRTGGLAVDVRLPVPVRADPSGTRIGPGGPPERAPGSGQHR
ncbi:sensor histidine kinase [Micromonospora echinospora]|uniref:histidine kinase n=1 Tax=Micromonospora echinospora TaxID=1877 RepID=A0ABR6MC50_MICEC|nr:sensor histidine kinase [Micromonospora echinospora]MBB5112960.1 signal transduction histidine kinase [Micromonospora echinospora]